MSTIKEQKNRNPKIGRPAKTSQEEQFKMHYLSNKKKFELQCQLLVTIHHTYFDQIPCNPINRRLSVNLMSQLFDENNCLDLYETLLKMNEKYFKNSSLFPEQKLRYTSIIDVSYLAKVTKQIHGNPLSCMQLLLIIFFFLFNQKLINKEFFQYFKSHLDIFVKGMINGPKDLNLNKIDSLIILLALEIAVREDIKIVQQFPKRQNQQIEQQ